MRIFKEDVGVMTMVRDGRDLGWLLARDEPVVKLDCLCYLFKVPDEDSVLLNNGVTTVVRIGRDLG